MSNSKEVVIIGSGLGGLACGTILAKNGYHVTVLEQGTQIGGCLQCFSRRGARFETGMHFVGSAAKGQTLDFLLNYLEVRKDISLSPLNPLAYDIVSHAGQNFCFANGREAYLEQMSQYFPKEKDNLNKYFTLVENVAGASSLHSLKTADSDEVLNMKYQMISINEVIDGIFNDELLKNVVVGNLPLYAAEKDKTPFATHAFITDFYNQSAFRIVGGSDVVAVSLKNTIEKHGGRVLTNHKVVKIVCDETKASGVVSNQDSFFEADYVISDAHPEKTLEMIDSKLIRQSFRNRIQSIPQTVGGFSVYLHFNENTVPYMNSNFYSYDGVSPWNCEYYTNEEWPKGWLYMHFCNSGNPKYAVSGVILSYMQYSDLKPWFGTKSGRRGDEYEKFKTEKAEKLLASVERRFPGLKQSIKHYYTSTPLTYYDYTSTKDGSMYGIAKDVSLGSACRVPHRTRIPNVYQTGQNINSHGILGVIVGSIVTCSEFLTAETIYKQIREANL